MLKGPGVRDNIWSEDFSPGENSDLVAYLMEKIRTVNRKKSRKEKREKLSEDFDMLENVLSAK